MNRRIISWCSDGRLKKKHAIQNLFISAVSAMGPLSHGQSAMRNQSERPPSHNINRRKGTGSPHRPVCQSCGFHIPDDLDIYTGTTVPCSDNHVRCIRCQWPVAKTIMDSTGICQTCLDEKTQRAYRRRKTNRGLEPYQAA